MFSTDIRRLCDEIIAAKTGEPLVTQSSDVVEKVAEDSITTVSEDLIGEIDQVLGGAGLSVSAEGKIALAKLLAIGDILAQGEL